MRLLLTMSHHYYLTHECQNQCSADHFCRNSCKVWSLVPYQGFLNSVASHLLFKLGSEIDLWSLPTGKDSCSPLLVILIWAAKPHSPRPCVWGLISEPCSVPLTLLEVPIQTSLPLLTQDAFLHITTSLLSSTALPCPTSQCPSSRLPSFW